MIDRPRQQTVLEAMGALLDPRNLLTPPRHLNEAAIRAACYNAYLGDGTSLCRVLGRYRMFVDTTDIGFSSHMLADGYWEMWVTEALVERVKPGMVCVDIGANLGYFTLLMGDLAGPATVHAFEPNPAVAARLRKTLSINGYGAVKVHELALADHRGEAAFHVPDGEPKNGRLVDAGEFDDTALVAIERFDSLGITPDFIKIDVEGAEEAAWRGMAGVLGQPRPLTIFLEFTLGRYADPARFIDDILRYGFDLKVIDPWRGVVPTSRGEVLAGQEGVDQMLVLTR